MPRPSNSKAMMLEALDKDDLPPPLDWVPDKSEARFGSPIGASYHIGDGRYKRIGMKATTSKPPRDVIRSAIYKILSDNSGSEFTAQEISAGIGMQAGTMLSELRVNGWVKSIRKNGKHHYSELKTL